MAKNQIMAENINRKENAVKIQAKIDKNKDRLNKLFNMYLDGEITEYVYNEKKVQFENDLEILSMRLSEINNGDVEVLEKIKKAVELFKTARDKYLGGTFETKRETIKLLCSNFSYNGEELTIIIKEAFQPLVEIANSINGGGCSFDSKSLTKIQGIYREILHFLMIFMCSSKK